MNFPVELKYTKEHEWIKLEGDVAIVGITDFAQGELGDIIYVEVETVGKSIAQDAVFGTVEAVKTVSDLYLPIAGEVLEVNGEERVKQARAACIEKNIPFNVDEAVNPASLKKFVRESLDAGQNIPHDLFGVHIQKSAEIKTK